MGTGCFNGAPWPQSPSSWKTLISAENTIFRLKTSFLSDFKGLLASKFNTKNCPQIFNSPKAFFLISLNYIFYIFFAFCFEFFEVYSNLALLRLARPCSALLGLARLCSIACFQGFFVQILLKFYSIPEVMELLWKDQHAEFYHVTYFADQTEAIIWVLLLKNKSQLMKSEIIRLILPFCLLNQKRSAEMFCNWGSL